MDLTVKKDFRKMSGIVRVPSDKSISHRAVIFASLANGQSVIKNFSDAADPLSSLEVCKNLGVEIIRQENKIIINSCAKLKPPSQLLYCGNSGTTMRLMAGILAGQNFSSVLSGDESLCSRPMKRIIEPLALMGAKIKSNNFTAPLEIDGCGLHSINYSSKLSSAQVKSCVLLAGLFADGVTTFSEPFLSRNHTEIMLKSMGADIQTRENTVSVQKSELAPLNIEICGDISSAAYFIAAGLIVPNSSLILKNVGLNPTRCGILEVLRQMGACVEILNSEYAGGEVVGDIKVSYCENLKSCLISKELIPKLIDEIPLIALLATQADGQTIIKDAQDLRNKESDRISTTVKELKKLGADIEETQDGMIINGKTPLKGGVTVDSHKDHRLAMTLYIAGLISHNEISIKNFEWVKISFPNFLEIMEGLKQF